MPQIPLIVSRETAEVGPPNSPYASPEAFGSQIGRALIGVGSQISSMGDQALQDEKQKAALKRQENVASRVAEGTMVMARTAQEDRLNAPADGAGVAQKTFDRQRDYIETLVAPIEDDKERQAVRNQLYGQLADYGQSQTTFEFAQSEENSKIVANGQLNGLENAIRGNADQYDNLVKAGEGIIDARPGLDVNAKATMKKTWRGRAAYGRFEGLLLSAKTEEDFDAIEKMLTNEEGRDWNNEFLPEQRQDIVKQIASAKKEFMTLADQQARAGLDSTDARNKANELIPMEEMSSLGVAVSKSRNAITEKRYNRLRRDQEILRTRKGVPPHELNAEANGITGATYPGVPNEISRAIPQATEEFGISGAYLGRTLHQEYGSKLRNVGTRGRKEFAPRAVGRNVDFRNMLPQAYDGVVVAGEIFGQPLNVVSAERSSTEQGAIIKRGGGPRKSVASKYGSRHTVGDAVDISTVGMSNEQKAKLTDALVQAGFTGFGEYKGHIHADMRANVTNTFRPGYGGWTSLSPEVSDTLVRRGFRAGASGESIDRSGTFVAANAGQAIDWTLGTDVLGPDGKPATSVMGPYQFQDKTWMGLMNDGRTPGRIGLDITGMSEKDLLALRANPQVATLMTAAYAEQNRKILQGTLGRDVNDDELYMAHLLGPTGASLLIGQATNNPDGKAADLMPQAAKNNKKFFYSETGRALTNKEAYNRIGLSFGGTQSEVQYGDAEKLRSMADERQKGIDTDPMTEFTVKMGNMDLNDLGGPNGFMDRGVLAGAAAARFRIPISEMKPFTANELLEVGELIKNGGAKEQLELLSKIQEMDLGTPGMAAAARKQLGIEDTVLGHAAELAAEGGEAGVASEIVRGNERLKDKANANIFMKNGIDGTNGEFNRSALGIATLGIDSKKRSAIFEASRALYAERFKGDTEFQPDNYQQVLSSMIGGMTVDEVNGQETVLPPGIDGETFDTALGHMTDAEFYGMSEDKMPPLDNFGRPVSVADVALEGKFEFLGNNEYNIRMSDGGTLTTGEIAEKGRAKNFVFIADPDKLNKIATRPEPEIVGQPELVPEDISIPEALKGFQPPIPLPNLPPSPKTPPPNPATVTQKLSEQTPFMRDKMRKWIDMYPSYTGDILNDFESFMRDIAPNFEAPEGEE